MAFRESDGAFLWQHTNPKLASGRANDWPFQGVCSSPLVEGDRLYYVSNRCELVCLDTKGEGKKAKVLWKFDMMEEVGSQPHNMSNSSPVSYGDLIFVSTSNGQDESHVHIPSPNAPAIIAVNKKTAGCFRQVPCTLQVYFQGIKEISSLTAIIVGDLGHLILVHIAQVVHVCDLVEVAIDTQVVEVRNEWLCIRLAGGSSLQILSHL